MPARPRRGSLMATIGSLASSERMKASTKLTPIDLHDWVAEVLAATASHAGDWSDGPDPTKLPPLAPSGMPASVSAFVGHERSIDQIESLRGVNRPLTLTGAGRCGKTRLALGVATRLCGAFPSGVACVPLAPAAREECRHVRRRGRSGGAA